MSQWLEHYGMSVSFLALILAFGSALYGVLLKKKKSAKEKKSPSKAAPYFILAGVLSVIAILLAVGTGLAFQKIQTLKANGPFPFGSGWVFYGYYDQVKKTFLAGPFEKIAARSASPRTDDNLPGKGDLLEVIESAKVYIPYFKQAGSVHEMDCPIVYKFMIEKSDETGVVLKPGARLVVRDVVSKSFTQNGISVWARVERFEPPAGGSGAPAPPAPSGKK